MKIALIFRHASHYRISIYDKIDKTFNSDFYFSVNPHADLKMISEDSLNNIKYTLTEYNLLFGFYYLKGMNNISVRKYDYIIIAGDIRDVSSWLLLLRSYITKSKVILWTHGWYGKENFIIKIAKKIYYSFAFKILVYGEYAKNLLILNSVNSEKIEVIYNSLGNKESISTTHNLGKSKYYSNLFENDFNTIIFIGRLTKVKKLNILIQSIEMLKQYGLNLNLYIIGGGEVHDELNNLVKDLGLNSNVKFHGESYNENFIAQAIYDADLCVSPGNVGLTAIHSMSYGTPVATHNDFKNQMPEFEIIVENKTGFFFEKDSIESLSESIKNWFDKYPTKNSVIQHSCLEAVSKRYNSDYQIMLLREIIKI